YGTSTNQAGVVGVSEKFVGVWGESKSPGHAGVLGKSQDWQGVYGTSTNQAGVVGVSEKFVGVWGESKSPGHAGVLGKSQDWQGVHGTSTNQAGVVGVSEKFVGVWGESKSPGHAGVFGKGAIAGAFDGNVHVTGDIILKNADCAEDFDIFEADTIEPGTVMIFGEKDSLQQSQYAYDKRVVGVISGAGNYKPGIILDKQQSRMNRKPVALMGKVYCKVDASYAPIETGDLLTTSDTPGHAMKAIDSSKAFGTVIGKAMHPITEGKGLIPILVALQ
ncbi:hypothetical protein V4W82_30260, partial [Bacillus thuringiensis]